MSEYTIETRRRSRSKTPFLRSSCDHENCEHAGEEGHQHHHHHQKKKSTAPNVHTIVEEVVEVTSSSSPSSKQSQSKTTQKNKTSDYSSEDNNSPVNITKTTTVMKETQLQKQTGITKTTTSSSKTTNSSSSTVITTKSKKLGGAMGLGATTSTPKSNYLLESFAAQFASGGTDGRRAKEVSQNIIDAEKETEAGNSSQSRSFSRLLGNSFSSATAADLSDHLAYQEYKRAGEYWKTTPKTDYTYSELSPHRRVLAPGVIAMPNMSRPSLENHHERVNYWVQRDPAQEEHIRRRYESTKYQQNRYATEKLIYDSGDEHDYAKLQSNRKRASYFNDKYAYNTSESWFTRLITSIVTIFSSAWTKIVNVGESTTGAGAYGGISAYESALYQTKLNGERRGFFAAIWHGIISAIGTVFRYIYLGISNVLYWDTWLLQSRNADGRGKKRFLLILLLLLPLLLLGGLFYYLHPNESFPPKSFSEYTFTLPELPALPSLPKVDLSDYVNQEKYDAFKAQSAQRLSDFRDWTDDYLLYLRTLSQNIIDEGRKLFQREELYERV